MYLCDVVIANFIVSVCRVCVWKKFSNFSFGQMLPSGPSAIAVGSCAERVLRSLVSSLGSCPVVIDARPPKSVSASVSYRHSPDLRNERKTATQSENRRKSWRWEWDFCSVWFFVVVFGCLFFVLFLFSVLALFGSILNMLRVLSDWMFVRLIVCFSIGFCGVIRHLWMFYWLNKKKKKTINRN